MALRRCVRSTRHAVLVSRRFNPCIDASNPIDSTSLPIQENGTQGNAPTVSGAGASATNTKRMEESRPGAARVVLLLVEEAMRRGCTKLR
mmetsp:Transcript_792/g.4942  ORF Transcript_792/g.4942 Transcript_792/m.4942 type:complete len:90 (-) Transcript_792:910-1179(-)